MPGRLDGKVCVITGTGGSIGRASALTFAREGASVVGCDVNVESAAETVQMVHAAGGKMVSLQPCRLDDPVECARLVELTVNELGRIDVLFNQAARSHFSPIESFSDEEWDGARRDEVDLVFYLTRAAWPYLKTSHGVIVNMASLNGSLSFKLLPALAHTTNKAGIIGMTRHFSQWREASTGSASTQSRRVLSRPTPPEERCKTRSSADASAKELSLVGLVKRRILLMLPCT